MKPIVPSLFETRFLKRVRGSGLMRGFKFGFTLLEVMVAVVLIAGLALTLNRFVVSIIGVLKHSSELSSERRAISGLISLLQTQLIELPPRGSNLLTGQPHKFGEYSSDTMEWGCPPGMGMMTSAATGDYRVSLELKPIAKTSSVLELGLRRRPAAGTQKDETWIPLMRPVCGLEIRYFHAQLNAKVDRWSDTNNLPALVYVSIQRTPDQVPYDAILTVPSSFIQK